jgi:tellurite resistance protein
VLPELTIKETAFSTKERADDVINKLNQLAASDGETDESEKKLIEKIIHLMRN